MRPIPALSVGIAVERVPFDEIAALPVCVVAWVGILLWKAGGAMPPFAHFFSAQTWPLTLGVFVACRFFDIAKPWPVSKAETLQGGLGIMADDIVAGLIAGAVVFLFLQSGFL